jgi:signal transduction histidine kinase
MLRIGRYCLCILAMLFSATIHAQRLPLETYTPANGLADARIIKTLQDSRGRMFFLSRNGFSVFDGQRFENFSQVNGVKAQLCNDIVENEDHSVDIYTFGGNIFRYENGAVSVDTSNRKLLTEMNIIIALGNNDYLLATNHRLLRKKNNRYTQLKVNYPGTGPLYMENMLHYKQYIVFTRWNNPDSNHIFLYDYVRQEITDTYYSSETNYLVKDPKNRIYFGSRRWMQFDTAAMDNGRLVPRTLWFEKWMPKSTPPLMLQFDIDGFIWLKNGNTGCCRVHPVTGEQRFYRVDDGLLPSSTNVFEDLEKNYWFIAPGNGVQKLQQSPLRGVTTINGVAVGNVTCINATPEGELIAQLPGKLLVGSNEQISITTPTPFYWQKEVWHFEDYLHFTNGRGRRFKVGEGIPGYNRSDFQPNHHISTDKEGRLLISGATLFTLDKHYRFTSTKLPYFADNVVVAEDNSYWVFTRSNQVRQLKWQGDSLHTVYSTSLPGLNPRYSILMHPGLFAIATRDGGIKFLRLQNGQLVVACDITQRNGLSNDFVYALVRRNEKELVAATASGLDLVHFSGRDTIITQLAASNNIFSAFSMLAQTKDGVVYANSEDQHLYKLDRTEMRTSNFKPQLVFKSISINGIPASLNAKNRFGYTENNLRFSVSYPSFLDNRNIRFIFSLKGNGRNWQQQGANADFEINNLQPGHYTLQVTANYPGRVYPAQTIEYRFTILQPVWKRWWFILLVIISIAAALFATIKAYLRRKLEKQQSTFEQQQAIERERTRIATDMHDDFGASLSRIKFISEKMLLHHRGDGSLQPELEKISGYSDEMAEKMGEIVWALNQKYDTLGDMVAFCRAYASEYLEAHNIEMGFVADTSERQLKGEVRRNLFLALKESLHNTVKHAQATRVNIVIGLKENILHIQIHDNGKGIDTELVRPFANGLDNTRKRIQDCGGTIQFTNNNGTLIDMHVPLKES